MFCGLCVEPCPTGAIQHTREFESTMKSIDSLVFRWVADPEKPVPFYRPVKGQDAPRAPVGEILRKRMAEASWIAPASILVPDGPKKD
jgi:NADH-quinone oxidoreductase subunit I/NAD(P)H-quinone oxidoreductase subunit I